MTASQPLHLHNCELESVLLPDKEGKTVRGIRITVFGEHFPMRALEPEILVGEQSAEMVEVSLDQKSIRGFFYRTPSDGATICVRYGGSQEGTLDQRFSAKHIRPLSDECQ